MNDLVIPIEFTNISTSAGDYSVKGPLSVTIPAGGREGKTTAVLFTPTDDLIKEDRIETVRIEGPKGSMMGPFVRGADLAILDAAGIRLSVSPSSIAEDSGAQMVDITASLGDAGDSLLARDVEVALSWGGTATAGDYSRTGGSTVTIPTNARSGTASVTITPVNDRLLEGDETIAIAGSVPGRTVTPVELTLTDDEMTPEVVLAVDKGMVSESDTAATITVSATLDPSVRDQNNATTVTLDLGGTATSGTDYSASWSPASRQITIPQGQAAGSNTVTLTLTPTDDQINEGDETVVVQGTASRDLQVRVATVTIEDNDAKGINLLPATLTVAEKETGSYEVWLGTQPTGDVTVTLSSTDATTASVDMNELTFTSTTWSARQTVTVTGEDDDRNNADNQRTADIRHIASGGGYDGVETAALPVTVTDDDEAASFSIDDASATEGGAISFTVTRSGATGDDATVDWSTADDTDGAHAASAADYTPQSTAQTLSFAAGDTEKTITVQTTQDTLDEEDETFLVKLGSPGAGTSISDDTGTGTITDDDAPPQLSFGTVAAVTEGASGATPTMSFTVNLSAASGRQVTVDYADAGTGSATAGTDYLALTAGTLTFAPGDTGKTIGVTVQGDDVDEESETVAVRLSSPVNAGFAGGATTLDATGTITDDDVRGITVSAAAGGVTVAEVDDSMTSGTTENIATYTVALDSQPTGTVTIDLESGDTTVATVSPASLEFTTASWGAKTVTVTGVSDDVDNADDARTTSITHTVDADDTDYEDETAAPVTVTVTDDEATPTVTLALDPATIAESGDGNASTVTATLDHASDQAVTVMVSVPAGAPVTQSGTTLTIAAEATMSTGTVTLTAVDNDIDAPDAEVTVSGTASGGGVADPADATLTITDDDAPTWTLAVSPTTIAESGTGSSTVTVSTGGTVTFPADQTITLALDGTAKEMDDYTIGSKSLTLTAGATSAATTVTAVDDTVDDDAETVEITASVGGSTVGATQTITITDDDTRGITVSAATSGVTVAEADDSMTSDTTENVATYTVVLTSEPTGTVTVNVPVPDLSTHHT